MKKLYPGVEVKFCWCATIITLSYRFSNGPLQHNAINVIRDLMASHDADLRFQDIDIKSRVASLYLPLLGIVMESLNQLYDPVSESRPRNSAHQVSTFTYLQLLGIVMDSVHQLYDPFMT